MSTIRIPPRLADAVDADADPARLEWLAALPALVTEIASVWELELGNPYLPGGQCAWVAPARNSAGDELVLKLGAIETLRALPASPTPEVLLCTDLHAGNVLAARREPCANWHDASHPDDPLRTLNPAASAIGALAR